MQSKKLYNFQSKPLSSSRMISEGFVFITFLVSVSSDSIFSLVDPTQAKIVFYYGSYSQSYDIVDATSILEHRYFMYPQTHCYIHGYNENQGNESVHVIVDAYSKREINLLTVDWGCLVAADYFSAILNMLNLAPVLGEMLVDLFNAGLPKDGFTLVGHSLGGQLAGLIGREFTKQSNGKKLPAIWALDPALPAFFTQDLVPFLQTIDTNDGDFVAIIHTDINSFGQALPNGHVDFYPNGGLQGQPGCPSGIIIPFSKEDLCSHQMSWRFWAEGIKFICDPKFYAFPATSYEEFLELGIENLTDKAIVMGSDCPRSARGIYYLKTNAEPRYAMGLDGY